MVEADRETPAKVSRWEVAGLPAAGVFYGAYHLGWLDYIPGVSAETLPDLMLMAYVAAWAVRVGVPKTLKWWRGLKA